MDSKRTIMVLTLLAALLVSGCTASESDESAGPEGEANITIGYSGRTTPQISEYSSSSEGNTFLILNLTVKNNGYEEISTNPMNFYVTIDNVKYDYSSETYSLENGLETVDVMNGGSVSGEVAFEVPKDFNSYKLRYEAWSDYNIEWIEKS